MKLILNNIYLYLFVCVCVCACVGLLHAGDRIIEVNGFPVDGMEPEQVIQVVVSCGIFYKINSHTKPYILYSVFKFFMWILTVK